MTASKETSNPANSDKPLSPWEAFTQADTAESFSRAWLGVLSQQIPGMRAGAVLVEDAAGQSFVPLAVWPVVSPELSRLSGVVEVCLKKSKPVIQPSSTSVLLELAYPVMTSQRMVALVALEMAGKETDAQAALRQIHWSSAWLSNLLSSRDLEYATQTADRTASVLDTLAVALRHDSLQQALFDVANALAQRFQAGKVAIGLSEHWHLKLLALSETAHFDKNTPLAKAYASAMEEAQDAGKPVHHPPPAAAPDMPASAPYPLHQQLSRQSGSVRVYSCPLIHGVDTVGVITLERSTDTPFTPVETDWLEAFAALAAPIIRQRREAEKSSVRRLWGEGRALLHRLFGPRHLIWKTVAALLVLLVLILSLVQKEYRVTAKTVIEGEVQRVAAAPFAGFIQAGYVRAGDTVKTGQVLAGLDDRELRMEQARWSSERDQYENKLREAVAGQKLADVQVVTAQLRQAEAQLTLVTDKIDRARVKAPFDGIVVQGDLSQQIGAPIELGKELFTLAPLQSYRVILQVDERDIRHVRTGQAGQMVIIGLAGDPIALKISQVTPIATSQDGKNFFRVEAQLQSSAPVRLRPGMEGVGKIETGQRQLWWIMTHSLTEWLSLYLWKWLP